MELAFQIAVIAIAVSAVISTVFSLFILWKTKPWKF